MTRMFGWRMARERSGLNRQVGTFSPGTSSATPAIPSESSDPSAKLLSFRSSRAPYPRGRALVRVRCASMSRTLLQGLWPAVFLAAMPPAFAQSATGALNKSIEDVGSPSLTKPVSAGNGIQIESSQGTSNVSLKLSGSLSSLEAVANADKKEWAGDAWAWSATAQTPLANGKQATKKTTSSQGGVAD